MLKNLVLGLGLSVAVLAPVQALEMDDLILDYQPSQAAVVELSQPAEKPSLYNRAYNAVEGVGLVDLGRGAGNLAYGTGRLVKGAGHVGVAALETGAALGYTALTPFSYAYDGSKAAGENWQNAKSYGKAASSNLYTAAADMPANYQNAKDGVVDLYEGAKKLLTPVYNGFVAAVKSDYVQNAWAGVKSWIFG